MQLKLLRSRRPHSDRRANVTVELALVTTFILLPLLAGAADFISILTARAQLNTAMQALLYYAWTNNAAAQSAAGTTTGGEATLVTAINGAAIFHISYSSAMQYTCIANNSGTYTLSSLAAYSSGTTCPTGQTLQLAIQYTVTTTATLPFPLPLALTNPYTLSATGTAEI